MNVDLHQVMKTLLSHWVGLFVQVMATDVHIFFAKNLQEYGDYSQPIYRTIIIFYVNWNFS